MPWDTLIRNGQVVTRDGVQSLDDESWAIDNVRILLDE